MSEVLSMPTFLRQHQKTISVCVAIFIVIFVLIWLSRTDSQHRGIEAFNHVITKKAN